MYDRSDYSTVGPIRVLVLGPQTFLQTFAEVTTYLSKCNFTGLSRHYAGKALILVVRKLGVSISYCIQTASAQMIYIYVYEIYQKNNTTRRIVYIRVLQVYVFFVFECRANDFVGRETFGVKIVWTRTASKKKTKLGRGEAK